MYKKIKKFLTIIGFLSSSHFSGASDLINLEIIKSKKNDLLIMEEEFEKFKEATAQEKELLYRELLEKYYDMDEVLIPRPCEECTTF